MCEEISAPTESERETRPEDSVVDFCFFDGRTKVPIHFAKRDTGT